MKIRSGFVSNSSSSSFIIISQGELTEEMLKEALGSEAEGFRYGEAPFFNSIFDVLEEPETVSLGWYGFEVPVKDIISGEKRLYYGSHADNEGNDIHTEMCSTNLTSQTDNVKIIWEPRS